ncbi:hypothetical protein LCGC14_0743200 [marine sediment metagenome]|uniref:Uncharacterized protein n=1 Tax=marine sediment metagenome TaxID=412755 RepID=A0A0F9Q627_9ZZZZ
MADSQRPYRGRRLDTNEWVYGYLRRTPRIAAEIYSRDLGGTFEVHPDSVKIKVRGQWFSEKELSDIVKKGLVPVCRKYHTELHKKIVV